jgi:recombination DNA repair RAD52 pathway protein
VIAEANRIFGFDAWTRETTEIRCVSERERGIGRDQKPGWGVTYIARVRVMVDGLAREGCGAGHGIDTDLGLAHESAIKEAETDAMKRALMTFGNPFGLALYDKQQRQVQDEPQQSAAYLAGEKAIQGAKNAAELATIRDRIDLRLTNGDLSVEDATALREQLASAAERLSAA